jgi:hypothetical protein
MSAGCGADAGQYDFVRTERTETPATEGEGEGEGLDGAIPNEPLEDWDVEGADPLSGIFVVETTVKAKLIIDLEARLVHRLRLVRRGTFVRQRFTLCDVVLPSVEGLAELTIPPRLRALVQSIPADSEGEFLASDAATGVAYVPEVPIIEIGPDDDDDDGHPGVTVTATALVCKDEEGEDLEVDLYASLKVGAGISGTVVDVDTLEGDADPTLEQEILGWSDDCISPAAALEIEIVPGSTWRAQRVLPEQDIDGNGNVSCPEILRTRVVEPETDAETQ